MPPRIYAYTVGLIEQLTITIQDQISRTYILLAISKLPAIMVTFFSGLPEVGGSQNEKP